MHAYTLMLSSSLSHTHTPSISSKRPVLRSSWGPDAIDCDILHHRDHYESSRDDTQLWWPCVGPSGVHAVIMLLLIWFSIALSELMLWKKLVYQQISILKIWNRFNTHFPQYHSHISAMYCGGETTTTGRDLSNKDLHSCFTKVELVCRVLSCIFFFVHSQESGTEPKSFLCLKVKNLAMSILQEIQILPLGQQLRGTEHIFWQKLALMIKDYTRVQT